MGETENILQNDDPEEGVEVRFYPVRSEVQTEREPHDHANGGTFASIYRGAHVFSRFMHWHFASTPHELTRTQVNIIFVLHDYGPMSMSELCEKLSISAAQASRTVKTLIETGYVAKEPGEDKRVSIVRVTDEGRHSIDMYGNDGYANFERLFAGLTEVEIDELAMCVNRGAQLVEKVLGPVDQQIEKGMLED